jgi:hypothetical protein
MKISAFTVSVNYAKHLALGIDCWKPGFDRWVIITDFDDAATRDLAGRHGLGLIRTNVFYERGAAFNKGAALAFALRAVQPADWILLLDADIVPEPHWRLKLARTDPQPGWFYGAWRQDAAGKRIPDDTHGYGYFQLFHASDPLAVIEDCWTHAGNYDSNLMLRWKHAGRLAPPVEIQLTHHGERGNWHGVGRRDAFERMQRERLRRGGGMSSIEGERIR